MYEVHGNYGAAAFNNEEDAITALWMLGQYHDLDINNTMVKDALNKHDYYEIGILSIIKSEQERSPHNEHSPHRTTFRH